MGYHLMIPTDGTIDNLRVDLYLGSAVMLDFYWESIGRQLNLPIIASITQMADYEPGFSLCGDRLAAFKDEMALFEKYWMNGDPGKGLPDGFLENVGIIRDGIDSAIDNGWTLLIA